MGELRYLLLCDGPSDEALLPILDWLLETHLPEETSFGEVAPLYSGREERRLAARLSAIPRLYPALDLLFVHRDAERASLSHRLAEIAAAIAESEGTPPHIPLVPVRMMEAWLLLDETAIRHAAYNPNGRMQLNLPPLRDMEALPDPKEQLNQLLRTASGLSPRRLRSFHPSPLRVARFIEDFSPLRSLPSFQQLEDSVAEFAADWLSCAEQD